jgi:1-deoxy-D-xylulose-5-phosphate synthase
MATTFLDSINAPRDLQALSVSQLEDLAREIRERIIDVVSHTGGHLAPSLGTVELTLALHYVLDAPHDKLIWDVGHQAYAHKLLTGRREQFATIRQYKGLSGFTKRSESAYDAFDVGHAGTSISAALGLAVARDHRGGKETVVAIIGDGSLTSGLAFEGLNNAGMEKRDLVIVVNDNRMSISKNVGALSTYLTKIITDPTFNRVKKDVWELTGRLASLGQRIRKLVQQIEATTKHLVVPGRLFADLGFQYLGPIDGHNLGELITVFTAVRKMRGPVLVHVITTKGKGYKHAEDDAERFHGVGGFEKATGSSAGPGKLPVYSDVFGRALVELGRHDNSVVAITAAMAEGTGLKYFRDEFPQRFFDIGIAEQHAVTFAAGLATQGLKPVVAIYSSFLQRSYDQIVHDVALQNLPVVFALDRAGLVGEDGPTHHGVFDLAYLRHIPNLAIMAPRDGKEVELMLAVALAHTAGPVAIRYPRGIVHDQVFPAPPAPVEFGRAEVLAVGQRVALLAVGKMVSVAWETAQILRQQHGLNPWVINLRFIKPLDAETLTRVTAAVTHVVCLEDNTVTGGCGSAVLEWLAGQPAKGPRPLLVGVPDRFVEHGSMKQLFADLGLDAAAVAGRVVDFLKP